MIKVAVLTVSDSCSQRKREDVSGQTIRNILDADIEEELVRLAEEAKADIVFTTGGTGFGPRDVTPEATAAVCERMVPGLPEIMRQEGLKKTKKAVLSRAAAGIRGNTLIINLPGSPKGVRESLDAIIDVLPHAVDMLLGKGH